MAGSIPDVPGHRVPYDLDGSSAYNYSTIEYYDTPANVWFTAQQLQDMNDETHGADVYGQSQNYVALKFFLLFAVPVDVTGLFYCYSGPNTVMEWSSDSITGSDGTWNNLTLTYNPVTNNAVGLWRTNIQPVNIPGMRAIRVRSTSRGGANGYMWISGLHVYGEYSNSGLELWHPTLDQKISGAHFDFGDVVRGFEYTKQFRVKNTAALTANSIVISNTAHTPPTPTLTSQMTFSDGGAYAPTVTIPSLAPGAISGIITNKMIVANNAQLSVWSGRVQALATTWT